MPQRVGHTLILPSKPSVTGYAAVVGKKEGEGPLAQWFDKINEDTTLGEASWEKAESALVKDALSFALDKSNNPPSNIDYLFAGDLLNQCTGTAFGLRDYNIPYIGVYGACSTMALTLAQAAIYVDGGAAQKCAAATSSHFCSAERQFRQPLEYGGQRPPTSQWTVTGAGAAIVENTGPGPFISSVTIGKMVDYGIKDANNMGAAMAPAAADTIKAYFEDTNTAPENYDLILTGDLARIGSDLLYELLDRENINIREKHNDCGLMIFDRKKQKVNAGASGCGCAATVLCSYVFEQMRQRNLKNILFCATGALMSTTTSQQGESIPSVAHLLNITI